MKRFKVYALTEKQKLIMTWWQDNSIYKNHNGIICDGAVRTGKSKHQGISFIIWAMNNFNHQDFAICGKTISSVRRNIITPVEPILQIMGFDIKYDALHNQYIKISKGKTENIFWLFGARDESSTSKISGMTLGGCLLDEVALMSRSFVEQALARCTLEDAKWWFNCNPEHPYHWFYNEWICKVKEKNILYINFKIEDGNLDKEWIERYKNLYFGAFYERFIEGKWVCSHDLIYPEFKAETHIRDRLTGLGVHIVKYYLSCDYGTVNPFSLGLWAVIEEYSLYKDTSFTMHRIDEYYHSSRAVGVQLTDEEYYENLKAFADGFKIEAIIIDPSAASFIQTIKKHNEFNIIKANDDIVQGIMDVKNAIKNNDLFVSSKCSHFLSEISTYRYNETSDMPRKENDHTMDDTRYLVNYIKNRERKNSEDYLQ